MSQRPQIGTGLWTTGLRWRPNARDAYTTDRKQGVSFRPCVRRDPWRDTVGGGFSSSTRWCVSACREKSYDYATSRDAEQGFRVRNLGGAARVQSRRAT